MAESRRQGLEAGLELGLSRRRTVASVRPWKEPSIVTISLFPPRTSFPYLRASLMAASFASAPLLQKKALPAKDAWTSRSARRPWASV
jgi:hypothetical protein